MTEDYLKRITNYIFDSRFTRALLIDGDWGCGKSYFVKNTLIEAIDKTEIPEKEDSDNQKIDQKEKSNKPKYYKSVLISLYGVSKVDNIQNAIYAACLVKFTDNVEDARAGFALRNVALFGMTALKGVAEYFNVKEQANSLFSKVGDSFLSLQKENIVLIFDDIERCQIDIVELMGFLNNLCENNGYRVILIANEDEIARHENEIARAINSQTALMDFYENHCALHTDDSNKKTGTDRIYNNLQRDKEVVTQGINKSTLLEHRDALFARNTQYERAREKLIGLTIRFNSRLGDVYDDVLMKNITEDRTRDFLKSEKQVIISIFEEYSHENLRTLISIFIAVEAMMDVFEVVVELKEDSKIIDVEEIIQAEKNLLLEYIIYAAINRVNGIMPIKMSEGMRVEFIHNWVFSKEQRLLRYAFVDEYWDTLVLNLNTAKTDYYNHVNETIKAALDRVNDKEHYKLALYRLKEWYYFSDEEVLDDIKRMKKELEEKKYYPADFKDIVYTLMCINNFDFGMKIDKDTECSNDYIYDATDENTFSANDNADSPSNKDGEILTETKTEYNKWNEVNINEYVGLMLRYTDDEELLLTSDMLRLLSENYDFAKRYRAYIQPLLDWINKKELAKLEKTDEGYGALDIDGDELYKFFRDRRDSYLTRKRFLSLYSYGDIKKYICNSSVKGLLNFADAISAVYNFVNLRDFFSEDYNTVNMIWTELKNDRESGRQIYNKEKSRTREIALRRLESCFKKYRNQLRDPNEVSKNFIE